MSKLFVMNEHEGHIIPMSEEMAVLRAKMDRLEQELDRARKLLAYAAIVVGRQDSPQAVHFIQSYEQYYEEART